MNDSSISSANAIEQGYEYELIGIEWNLKYEQFVSESPHFVRDETYGEEIVSSIIECDEEGVPKGQSIADIRKREEIIDAFFRKWYAEHPDREIYNNKVKDRILVRKISIDEAKQHASKRYLSTIAIIHHFEEILANACSIRKTAVKQNDRNQSKFDYMLIMSYQCDSVGVVKLTVGIKKKHIEVDIEQEVKTQYAISVLREGESLVEPTKTERKKKAPHKK